MLQHGGVPVISLTEVLHTAETHVSGKVFWKLNSREIFGVLRRGAFLIVREEDSRNQRISLMAVIVTEKNTTEQRLKDNTRAAQEAHRKQMNRNDGWVHSGANFADRHKKISPWNSFEHYLNNGTLRPVVDKLIIRSYSISDNGSPNSKTFGGDIHPTTSNINEPFPKIYAQVIDKFY